AAEVGVGRSALDAAAAPSSGQVPQRRRRVAVGADRDVAVHPRAEAELTRVEVHRSVRQRIADPRALVARSAAGGDRVPDLLVLRLTEERVAVGEGPGPTGPDHPRGPVGWRGE